MTIFLQANGRIFPNIPLPEYVIHMYETLVANYFLLPNEIKAFLPFFIINNWLEAYTTTQGISGVLRRMVKRTSLPNETTFAMAELKKNYTVFRDEFYEYFPQLINYVEERHQIEIMAIMNPALCRAL
jgi:acyl carrier protein phosphodiesterase